MEVPRHWRLKKERYALVGQICSHCTGKIFPPRDVCPHCGGETGSIVVGINFRQPSIEVTAQEPVERKV